MSYEAFLDSLANKDRQKEDEVMKRYTISDLRKYLLSDTKNPFLDIYPEKQDILKNWYDCTYYRIQAALATEYCNLVGTVIVFLPPFDKPEKFINYFGVEPSKFVNNYIKDKEFILPLIGDVGDYKREEVKQVYEPIFKDFEDIGDEKKCPVYANRIENCLLRGEDKAWKEFRKENIDAIKCTNEPVKIGDLPIKDPKTEIGEKVAWLKLIGMAPLAEDIKGLAKQDTELAVQLDFTANDLYTAPLFYTRKTLKTVASKFDLSIYKEAIEGLIKYKERTLSEKTVDALKRDICYINSGFKRIISSKRDATDPIKSTVATAKDKESRNEIPKTILNEGYDDLIFTANKKIPKLREELLKNTEKADEVRDEMREVKNELSDSYYKEVIKIPGIVLKTIDTTLGFLSSQEMSLLLDTLRSGLGTIASFSEVVWKDKIKIPLESRCIEIYTDYFINRYPLLKYNPTIYAWQIK